MYLCHPDSYILYTIAVPTASIMTDSLSTWYQQSQMWMQMPQWSKWKNLETSKKITQYIVKSIANASPYFCDSGIPTWYSWCHGFWPGAHGPTPGCNYFGSHIITTSMILKMTLKLHILLPVVLSQPVGTAKPLYAGLAKLFRHTASTCKDAHSHSKQFTQPRRKPQAERWMHLKGDAPISAE